MALIVGPPFGDMVRSSRQLGNDDYTEIEFKEGFEFTFYGEIYASIFINSNGNLTFGEGDTDYSESVSDFINGPPRIAPIWCDLCPSSGGQVYYRQESDKFIVTWEEVPEWPTTGSNTFQVVLYDDGRIDFGYGHLDCDNGLVGIAQGNGGAYSIFAYTTGNLPITPEGPLTDTRLYWETDYSITRTSEGLIETLFGDLVLHKLGNDESAEIDFTGEFEFLFYGTPYTSIFINSNGHLTFGIGDTWFPSNPQDFIDGPPRIAPICNDFCPSSGGTVYYRQESNKFIVTWDQVPLFAVGGSNTFQVVLYDDSRIGFGYDRLDANEGLVGVAQGGGQTSSIFEYNEDDNPSITLPGPSPQGELDDTELYWTFDGTNYILNLPSRGLLL